MKNEKSRRIPPWLWSAAIAGLGGVVALLLVADRRPDLSEAFRYDIARHQQVDPKDVLFKETGELAPGLETISAVAVGPAGGVFVAGEDTLVAYGGDGAETARLVLTGTPHCLAVAPDGDVLLGMMDRVEVLDASGAPKATWDTLGGKARITSIVASEREVYVADAGHRIVLRFDRAGGLLGRIGEKDPEKEIPGFIVPSPYLDVAFDSHGALWAVNPGRHGLESYRPNGDPVTSWYRPSMEASGFCGCCNPTHIAFRNDGSLVTAEKGLSRVKLYSPDWKLLGLVAGPDAFDEDPLRDLAVDARGRVFVVDGRRRAVRIFEEAHRTQ